MGKRGNGVNCVEGGGDAAAKAQEIIAKAKARANLARTVSRTSIPSPAGAGQPTPKKPEAAPAAVPSTPKKPKAAVEVQSTPKKPDAAVVQPTPKKPGAATVQSTPKESVAAANSATSTAAPSISTKISQAGQTPSSVKSTPIKSPDLKKIRVVGKQPADVAKRPSTNEASTGGTEDYVSQDVAMAGTPVPVRRGWSYADTGSQPPPTPTPSSIVATPVRPRNLLRESPMKSPKPASPMSVEKPWPAHDEPYTWHAGWWGWTPQSWSSAGWGWDNYGWDSESKWTWGRRDTWERESTTTAASTPSPASEPSPSHPPTQQQSQEVKQALNRGLTTVSEQELTQQEAEEFIRELETQVDGLDLSEKEAQTLSKLRPLDTQSTMQLDTQDMNDVAAATQQEVQQNPTPETKPQQPTTKEAQPQQTTKEASQDTQLQQTTSDPAAQQEKIPSAQTHPQGTKQQQPPSKEQADAQEQKPPEEAKPQQATNEATQQETPKPPPSQEQGKGDSGIIDQAQQGPVDDTWRKNKHGQILTPAALYSRFYRSARSSNAPPEVQQKLADAEHSANRTHKMHELYVHYLSCRADWKSSVIVVTMRKETKRKSKLVYLWKSYRVLKAELGEELAKDLATRHMASDPKMSGKFVRPHPDFPLSEEMRLYKSFQEIRDEEQKNFAHSAEFQLTAEGDEDEIMQGMDDAMAAEDDPQPLQNGKPKEVKEKKEKKEKTWRALAAEADKKANADIVESEGFEDTLTAAGVAPKMKRAILDDVESLKGSLMEKKALVASALGKKYDEARLKPLVEDLQELLKKFKACAEPVKAAERKTTSQSKPKAKAKGRSKKKD
ncbi:unnamed protein product [Symbiodinium sp. CCMP2592]|nr:unnamed protein product [Symbiodinium sp. CCMP2592]